MKFACGHKPYWNDGCSDDYVAKSLCYQCLKALIGTEVEFIRFGAPPKSGQSRNHAENKLEAGVSCYLIQNGKIMDTVRGEFLDRQPYIGKGVMVDTGSDDEIIVEIITCRKASKRDCRRLGIEEWS
jgi:hypothetical protein